MVKKKILIIGGVAGGATAAAHAQRMSEEAEIIIFEKGPHVSFAVWRQLKVDHWR